MIGCFVDKVVKFLASLLKMTRVSRQKAKVWVLWVLGACRRITSLFMSKTRQSRKRKES